MNKLKNKLVLLVVFVIVVILHLAYFKLTEERCGNIGWFQRYVLDQEYLLGFSYALSFTFMAFTFLKYKENRKNALKAGLGSGLLAVFLWFSCFFFGCCGSPIIIVYLNLFGLSTLRIPKAILLLMTVVFIGIAYILLMRKPSNCCCNGKPCKEDEK